MYNHSQLQQPTYQPPISPHQYEQDSFEAQQLSRSFPHPTPIQHQRNYELTFKKQQQQQYFAKSNTNRSLFNKEEKQLLVCLKGTIEYFQQMQMQELANLPFADLYSLDLDQYSKRKLMVIGQILQVKRMRLKLRSVEANIISLQTQDKLNQENRHRLYLLELLWKQLTKKLFVQALKLNTAQNKFIHTYGQQPHSQEALDQTGKYSDHQNHNERNNQSNTERRTQMWNGHSQEEDGDTQLISQCTILNQVITSILNKTVFSAFAAIYSTRSQQQQIEPISHSQREGRNSFKADRQATIKQISQPFKNNNTQRRREEILPNDMYESEQRDEQNEQNETDNKLEQLWEYIEELHEECANSHNLLHKYFIKWKIHQLEGIAESIFQQMQNESQQEDSSRQNHQIISKQRTHFDQRTNKPSNTQSKIIKQTELEEIQAGRFSRLTSQNSQAENSLKQQKKLLKDYIRVREATLFIRGLRELFQVKNIKYICRQVHQQSIMKKAFLGWKLSQSYQNQFKEKQLYCIQMSQHQLQDDGTSQLFYKTTLLYRYFYNLQRHMRNSKMQKILNLIYFKMGLRTLVFNCMQARRQQLQCSRKIEQFNSRLLFKYFSAWKLSYLNECKYLQKYKEYMQQKEQEQLRYYFSALNYNYKKAVLRNRKIYNLYSLKLKTHIFRQLKIQCWENKQLRDKQSGLVQYLHFQNSITFMGKFQDYYRATIEHQRMSIRQEKLKRTVVQLHALQLIKQWRKRHLKKNTYQAIQGKLIRIKNKQRKRQIMRVWYQRMIERVNAFSSVKSNQSENHKDWLVKYYGDLCSTIRQ